MDWSSEMAAVSVSNAHGLETCRARLRATLDIIEQTAVLNGERE
jgi:hypothetical protein